MKALSFLALALILPLTAGAVEEAEALGEPPPPDRQEAQGQLQQLEQETLDWLAEEDPEYHGYLLQLRQTEPLQYQQELLQAHQMQQLSEEDPETFGRLRTLHDRQEEFARHARELEAMPPEDREDHRPRLTALAEEVVDLRHALRRTQIDRIRQEAQRLEDELEGEEARRDELVEGLVDRALRGGLERPGLERPGLERPEDDGPVGGL